MAKEPELFGVIPDMLIVSVADRYLQAAVVLRSNPAANLLALPVINAAIIAIELYLKSLNATTVYSKINDPDGFRQLHSKAMSRDHHLSGQYEDLDFDVRWKLEDSWRIADDFQFEPRTLRLLLKEFDGVFQKTRYPFEENNGVDGVNIDRLVSLARFLKEFIYEHEEEFYAWSRPV
ncbi:hypothetical protein HJB51_29045 [Rhizobium lentis]|uniref:hypothetical protein n=1 Tax=Rhizobium lentis TaxID=1138194 RepID=UPI001C83E6EA|nr:hypothetical protein [Rhizobium lentis]MBX5111980.1 hypothetical protein [Rhizobium lentis]